MKRIGMFLLAALLLCLSLAWIDPVTSCASELDTENKKQQIDVYAKTASGDVVCSTIPVINGEAQSVLEDGRTISVTQAPEYAVVLKVIAVPESETEAWNWIKSCLTDGMNVYAVYDIYFEDISGNRINADGAEIRLSSDLYDPAVYSVNVSGQSSLLESTLADGSIIFMADGSHYYVLTNTEGKLTPDEDQNGNSGGADDKRVGNSVDYEKRMASIKTGDDIFLQSRDLALLAVLAVGILILIKNIMRRTL